MGEKKKIQNISGTEKLYSIDYRLLTIEGLFMDMIDKKKLIEDLKDNPIYAMSLGGKELFHSNMLAWLLMRQNNNPIKKIFGIEEHEVVLNVFREHQNLDLIVVYANKEELEKEGIKEEQYLETFDDPDSYLPNDESRKHHSCFDKLKFIIIENKFKSIPEQKQLAEYSAKLKGKKIKVYNRIAEINKTRCCLFAPDSVLDNALGFGINNSEGSYTIEGIKWEKVTYEQYCKNLAEIVDDSKEGNVIGYYKDMLSKLLDILSKWLEDDIAGGLSTPDRENIKLLKQIRFYDIYTKLWYGITQNRIEKKFADLKKQPDRRFFGMTRSLGFCEWQYEYNEILSVGVQIQNTSFRVFVEPYYEKKPKDKFTFKPGVDNEDDFKELILEWGNSIINKAFEDVDSKNSKEPEYKCLRFGDFKYVQRILPEETKIDSLASIVFNAMKQMTTENIEQLSNKILRFLNT